MDWLTVPLVRDQLAMARRDWDAISFPAAECWPIQRAIETGSFESPIEAVFAMWWRMYECVMVGEWEGSVVLRPQHDVTIDGEAFRLDFAVIARDPLIQQLAERFNRSIRIAIELDGHEFHERTKAQVARRNYRDRVLQLAGWTVLHVSGSELIRLQADAVRPLFVLAGKTYREMSAQLSADLQQVI